jgi:hypothetical protein
MGRVRIFGRPVSDAEAIGRSPVGIASTAVLRNFNKAKRNQLSDRWSNSMPINAVALKIIKRHGQAPVVHPPVVGQLYF